jgi:hypothetical protein
MASASAVFGLSTVAAQVVLLDGAILTFDAAQNAKSPAIAGLFGSSIKVVAGAGFEPAAFRL